MRDYAKDLFKVWTNGGDQDAFERATELLAEIKIDIANAQREYSAIEALIAVLRNRPTVSVAEEPAEPENGLDPILPALRSRHIIEAAMDICWELEDRGWANSSDGTSRVTTQEVLERIQRGGLSLGVQQPHAVIGTVLANDKGFERIAKNTFARLPEPKELSPRPTEPDDLPF